MEVIGVRLDVYACPSRTPPGVSIRASYCARSRATARNLCRWFAKEERRLLPVEEVVVRLDVLGQIPQVDHLAVA